VPQIKLLKRGTNMKKYVCVTFCIALIVLFTTSFAFSQALDGLWFQAKSTYKGYTVDAGGLLTKASGKLVNYINFTWETDGSNYNIVFYDEAGNMITSTTKVAIGANEEIIEDLGGILGDATQNIYTHLTPLIKIKRGREGPLKSVTITSMGCEVYGGGIDGNDFYGGCTMKAKSIEAPPFPL